MSAAKNNAEVLIGGKVYTLSGFESEEYLQQVATYLNRKMNESFGQDGYRKQSPETKIVLLGLNIADDYFKATKQAETLESDLEQKEKDIYELKHDLISLQTKLEAVEKELSKLKTEKLEEEKKNIRLEAELSECRKNLKKYEQTNK